MIALPRWFRPLLTAAFVFVLFIATMGVASAEEAGTATVEDENKMMYIIRSIGWFLGGILLGCSIWLIAIVVLLFLDLRMTLAIPPGFVEEFTDIVNKRKFKEAYDMAKTDPSFLGRVLTSGMARLQYGLEDAREAAYQTLESIKADKTGKNNYTAVVAALGPMLGLVGTVFGMIGAFKNLGKPGSSANPTKLADDVGHALSVTLVGIAISVPAIAFNAFFRNRITKVTMDVGHIADDLLTQMYHNSKKPAPPGGAPASVASPATPPVG